MTQRFYFVILMLVFCCTTSWAGWVLHQESSQSSSVIYIEDNKWKSTQEGLILMVDIDQETMALINPESKTYWKGTPQESKKLLTGEAILNELDEQLKELPPEQREAFKKTLQEHLEKQTEDVQLKPVITVKKLDDKQKIAGYETTKYAIYQNGILAQEFWLAENVGIEKDFDVAKLMSMVKEINPSPEANPAESPEVIDVMKKGFVLKTIEYDEDEEEIDWQKITKVEKQDLDSSMFTIPADYKKVGLLDVM